MIPKKIHYCWFGNEPMPVNLQTCMKSWKKVLPEYEWRLWTLESFDVNAVPWTKEAFEAKAWAFVADYVRLYALYTEGGIYMDTDVWVKKTFDPYLSDGFFTSIEYHPEVFEANERASQYLDPEGFNTMQGSKVPGMGLLSAILGAEKGHPYLKEALSFYQNHHFMQADGSWLTSLIAPDVLAQAAEKFGMRYNEKIEQALVENIKIYPYQIFAGAYTQVTKDTVAVHLCTGSWRARSAWRAWMSKMYFWLKILLISRK